MPAAVCPWCSAALTEGVTECPSCGANLVPDDDPNVPGVTAVDAASIIRSKTAPRSRSRLLSWISGEDPSDIPSRSEARAVAPPDPEVRREILRLELEAEVANLQAEADALLAEAAAEGRTIERSEGLVASQLEPAGEDPAAPDGEVVTESAPSESVSPDVGSVEASQPEDQAAS